MNFIQMRKILADALNQSGKVEKVHPLGNVVYATVNNVEFELVIKKVVTGAVSASARRRLTVP